MSKKKKVNYTEEFKQESAKLALKSDCSLERTAKNLGVSATALRNWIKKYRSGSVKEKANSMELEIKQLKKELSRVRQERDILKKATAYFAGEVQ